MKIAILTQPLRYNYGGILQNFALQTVLRSMGHEVVTLDPKRYRFTWWQHILLIIRHLIGRYLKRHKSTIIFEQWNIDKTTRVLGKNIFPFINKNINRKEYTNLKKDIISTSFDAYVVGSDQVWRKEYNPEIENMFLDFTQRWNVKRIAYAASFGVDKWTVDEKTTEKCKDLLKLFDFVSVRELSGITLCNQIFGIDAIHVLDPTLLLTKEDYISLLCLERVPKNKGNLFVYFLDYTDDKRKLIQHIVDEYHLMPFRVNSTYEDPSVDINRRVQPPIEQWVRGFYDADFIITDSFHGSVFSIIFGKPFIIYGNEKRGMERFSSLINLLNLNNSIIMHSSEFHGFKSISFQTQKKLESLRIEAKQLLKKSLC